MFLMFILLIGCVSPEAAGAASNTQTLSNGSGSNKAAHNCSTLDNEQNGVDVR
jgi:hypothetical protein